MMSAIPHWIPKVIIGLMLVGMTTTMVWQGRSFLQEREVSRQPVAIPEHDSPKSTAMPEVLLSELELFGTRTEADVPTVVETAQLPITNLRLVLRGVAEAAKKTPASALIEGPDQETLNYRVGSVLPGNARLHAVQMTSVILDRGGRLENLRFPEEETLEGLQVNADSNMNYNGAENAPYEPDSYQPAYDSYVPPPEESIQQYSEPMTSVNQLNEAQKEEIKARLQELRERLRAGYQ